jgi:hypothetical protein
MASLDPTALDLAAVRLMGFDEARIPKVWETMASAVLRVTEVRRADDVEIAEVAEQPNGVPGPVRVYALDELECPRPFVPHPGWLNHIERAADKNESRPPESEEAKV